MIRARETTLRTALTVVAPACLLALVVLAEGCRQILGVEDPVPCDTVEACDPGPDQPCLEGLCVQGECVYQPRADGPVAGCGTCTAGELVAFADEGKSCYTGPAATKDQGQCKSGTWTCGADDVPACDGEVLPGQETCGGEGTGVDEDCDGQVDVGGIGCSCEVGQSMDCYDGPPNTENVGVCAAGQSVCTETPDGFVFGDCTGAIKPAAFDSCITDADEDCTGDSPVCTCAHQFSVSFGGPDLEEAVGVAEEADGSIIVLGTFSSPTLTIGGDVLTNDGNQDVVLMRLDSSGNPLKAKAYGGVNYDYATDVAAAPDGGIWLSGLLGDGSSEDFGGGATITSINTDGFLVKLDHDFGFVAKHKIGANANDTLRSMAVTPDGGVVITGTFQGSVDFGCTVNPVTDGSFDFYLASYAADGSCQWAKNFGTATSNDAVYALAIAPNGDVVITGTTDDAIDLGGGPLIHPDTDPFLARFDKDGNHIFSEAFSGTGYDSAIRVTVLSDESIWINGTFTSGLDLDGNAGNEVAVTGAQPDVFLAHFDGGGAFLGAKSFDATAFVGLSDLKHGPDDSMIMSLSTSGAIGIDGMTYTPTMSDAFVVKLKPDGTVVCVKQIGSSGSDLADHVFVDDVADYFVAGAFTGPLNVGGGTLPNAGSFDMFLIKYRQ